MERLFCLQRFGYWSNAAFLQGLRKKIVMALDLFKDSPSMNGDRYQPLLYVLLVGVSGDLEGN
jgi:hypothetical protein